MLLWCVLRQKALLPRSSKLLPIFPGERSHFFLGQLCRLGYSSPNISRYAPMKFLNFFFFFFLLFHLQFISGALNYTGASFCATSFYLPRACNAPLGGALVLIFPRKRALTLHWRHLHENSNPVFWDKHHRFVFC